MNVRRHWAPGRAVEPFASGRAFHEVIGLGFGDPIGVNTAGHHRSHATCSAGPPCFSPSVGNSPAASEGLPLCDDKQHHRCADQNKKSHKGRHNAYLFKRGHDPSPNAKFTRQQGQRSPAAGVAVRSPTQGVKIFGGTEAGEPERLSPGRAAGTVLVLTGSQSVPGRPGTTPRLNGLSLTPCWGRPFGAGRVFHSSRFSLRRPSRSSLPFWETEDVVSSLSLRLQLG